MTDVRGHARIVHENVKLAARELVNAPLGRGDALFIVEVQCDSDEASIS
jgi:hypothetical protein